MQVSKRLMVKITSWLFLVGWMEGNKTWPKIDAPKFNSAHITFRSSLKNSNSS
jgi:hypothetical protein